MPHSAPRDGFFRAAVTPDREAFRDCILRLGTPRRVHHIELFLDGEVQDSICTQFGLQDGLRVDGLPGHGR